MKTDALFISYDGLLDPLGGSQILPYVRGIAAHPRSVHVLSFEKPDRYAEGVDRLRQELDAEGIRWTPLIFSSGTIGKIWDLLRMYVVATNLTLTRRIGILHCRGHLSAQVGAFVKFFSRAKLLFDFRGLWVDERVDKGGWVLSKASDRFFFRAFKRLEQMLLRRSDHVVVLTHAIVPLIQQLGVSANRITVIPCCADFEHFRLPDDLKRKLAKQELGLLTDSPVIGYLGSAGRMYMTESFLDFAEMAIDNGQAGSVLCITPDVSRVKAMIEQRGWADRDVVFRLLAATRAEIPALLSAIDVLVSFFLPTPARIGTSPTKMAECFAQGIPMITNAGVGDVESIIEQLHAGAVVDPADPTAMLQAAADLPKLIRCGGSRLRDAARPRLGLEVAARDYGLVYRKLEGTC